MYIPHWTYDAETYSTYHGMAGHYYYVQETDWVEENGERKQVTRTVQKIAWLPTSGVYAHSFDDIIINASEQIDEHLMQKLQPFHLTELVHYKPEFLSGFLAERYSRGLKEGWEKAKALIKNRIREGVIRQISADQVSNLHISTSFNSIKYKHLLLPVWISSYTYRGKVYQYMINGQTGEVQGKSPLSPWKIGALILLGLVIGAGIAFWWMHTQETPMPF